MKNGYRIGPYMHISGCSFSYPFVSFIEITGHNLVTFFLDLFNLFSFGQGKPVNNKQETVIIELRDYKKTRHQTTHSGEMS